MSLALRLVTFAAALACGLVVVATTAGQSAPATAMHLTIAINAVPHGDEVALPSTFAVPAGGTVTITFRNHTKAFHTFTVRALGISTLIQPAGRTGARDTSVTFVAPYGVYDWRCAICSTAAHPHMHSMFGKMYAIVNA